FKPIDFVWNRVKPFPIENSTPIPNDSEAVWRVDNKWMLDLNEWMESSIPRTLSDDTHANCHSDTTTQALQCLCNTFSRKD
ncbi:hypothetical protein HID58_058448, partial [Brassica napus]